MFNLFKKEKPSKLEIRDTLFGDMPITEWPKDISLNAEPWSSFVQARKYLDKGDQASARAVLQKIADTSGLEPRHYLQAWHFLRQLGVNPPPERAKRVFGVIVEVGLKTGTDIVAAYADYTARYLNYSGAGVIWERPDDSLDGEISALLQAGQAVASAIGPWEQARPPAPPADYVRLNMLTPSGLHFGYGPFETLANDPMGKALIDPATRLMVSLTSKGTK